MATASDVVRYLKTQTSIQGEMHAHKLLYYAQAWNLAWDGEPLFDEEIQAWEQGPVLPDVRRNRSWELSPSEDVDLTPQQKENVRAVAAYYAHVGAGRALSALTHEESPWRLTWGDYPPGWRGNDTIQRSLMRREYTLQSARGEGPRRVIVEVPGRIPPDDVEATSSNTSRRWARTLELLAE